MPPHRLVASFVLSRTLFLHRFPAMLQGSGQCLLARLAGLGFKACHALQIHRLALNSDVPEASLGFWATHLRINTMLMEASEGLREITAETCSSVAPTCGCGGRPPAAGAPATLADVTSSRNRSEGLGAMIAHVCQSLIYFHVSAAPCRVQPQDFCRISGSASKGDISCSQGLGEGQNLSARCGQYN